MNTKVINALRNYRDSNFKEIWRFNDELFLAGFGLNWVFEDKPLEDIRLAAKEILKESGRKANLNRDSQSVMEFIISKQLHALHEERNNRSSK